VEKLKIMKEMTLEELKSEIIENFKDMNETHIKLNDVNNEIIKSQKEHIAVLENYIKELREIIEKYLLKDVTL
jgi:endonuclease IV